MDQFLVFNFVNHGDWHDEVDIYERLAEADFHVTLGEHSYEKRREFSSRALDEPLMKRHWREICALAEKEDPEKIVAAVKICREDQIAEAREKDALRQAKILVKRMARVEAEEYREFKRAFGLLKKRKRAKRYSARR